MQSELLQSEPPQSEIPQSEPSQSKIPQSEIPPPCGIICVNKPTGITSFVVVAKARRALGTKKIGHGGTLDPLATGVLPLFVGGATRVIDFLPDTAKTYSAKFQLGIITTTQDITGEVIRTSDLSEYAVTYQKLCDVVSRFFGDIEQLPPMFSAVKVDGKRLYKAARQGSVVERAPRVRHIYDIAVTEFDGVCGALTMRCSAGTYVRTVIHDIGVTLGCGAAMTALERTVSHGFTLADCVDIDDISRDALVPVDTVFADFPAVALTAEQYADLYCGRDIVIESVNQSFDENVNQNSDDDSKRNIDCNSVIALKYANRITAFASRNCDGTLNVLRRLTRNE